MSFKPTNAKIDLSLDMSDYLLDTDPEKVAGGIIQPTKVPTAQEYVAWAEKATSQMDESSETEMRLIRNPAESMDLIIDQIDYWYGKGKEWWLKRCPFPVLQEVLNYLSDKVTKVQKK